MFKFISKAMLSVVMDKSAREKLEKQKAPAKKAAAKKKGAKTKKSPAKKSDKDAKAPVLAKRPDAERAVKKILAGNKDEKAEAFQKLLSSKLANAKPGTQKPAPDEKQSKQADAEREKLITAALAVQRAQSHLLDDVDDKVKEKLRRLAEEKLMGGGPTKH